jgi:hypothetical protein
MKKPGPVRGRLDGTAPYRLLRLACATHADARLTLRCAPNTYEVRIRDGAPRSATRMTADGAMVHGAAAMGSLLGERAGRFTLSPERAPIDPDLTGSLHQQIAAWVAKARGLASAPRIALPAEVAPPPPSAPRAFVPPPVDDIPVDVGPLVVERAQEAPARTVPLPPRAFVPRLVTVTPRATAERTLPLGRPVTSYRPPTLPRTPESPTPRSWGIPLRWVGVAAVAALGLVLGAGVRALRQPAPPPPVTAAAVAPPR